VQSGISSRQLGLEMTESSLIPNLRHGHTPCSASLRRLGVSLLVDDFGNRLQLTESPAFVSL